mmetsp:Transcript_7824/g.18175  ORF Transcript_7824/g.18175 Transcript_7824/m.18175 type:complete len:348 (+) Transcript_7824:597-1640(+)
MDSTCRGVAVHAEGRVDLLTALLGAREHHDALVLADGRLEELQKTLHLLCLLHHLHNLCHILVAHKLAPITTNANLGCAGAGELSGDALHGLGPGRSEHQCLTTTHARAESKDLLNLWLETHVQHPVSLVENRVLHLGHADRGVAAARWLEEIVETARGRHNDVASSPHRTELIGLGRTTVQDHAVSADGRTELLRLITDLDRQLTGGSHDHDGRSHRLDAPEPLGSLQAARGLLATLLGQRVERRQEKSAGLAAACFGNSNNVPTSHCNGPGLGLNGRRTVKSLRCECPQKCSGERSIRKLHVRIGTKGATFLAHTDLVAKPESSSGLTFGELGFTLSWGLGIGAR